jgi:DNA-binding Lrp family transcriptional regulator
MSNHYWSGFLVLDPADIERRFSNEQNWSMFQVDEDLFDPEESEEMLREIESVIEHIPPREADFVELYFFHRIRQTIIADMFNVSQPTVCYRLRRALERIRFLVERPEFEIKQLRKDLEGVLEDPIDVEIALGMVRTTCQTEVAKGLGVSQGFVRHRFLRTIKSLSRMGPSMRVHAKLLEQVRSQPNILKEVHRASWDEPVIHVLA